MSIEELLEDGWVKESHKSDDANNSVSFGSKSYCTFLMKGSEVIQVNDIEEDPLMKAYNRGYEDALRTIKVNLEHFKKDVYSITMIYDGCGLDTYDGESDCEKLLKENILGGCK